MNQIGERGARLFYSEAVGVALGILEKLRKIMRDAESYDSKEEGQGEDHEYRYEEVVNGNESLDTEVVAGDGIYKLRVREKRDFEGSAGGMRYLYLEVGVVVTACRNRALDGGECYLTVPGAARVAVGTPSRTHDGDRTPSEQSNYILFIEPNRALNGVKGNLKTQN
jgi:hypothetical protein